MERTETRLLFIQRTASSAWNSLQRALSDDFLEDKHKLLASAARAAEMIDEHLTTAYEPCSGGLRPREILYST